MKHIGIDVRLLYQTGVGTYLQNLLHYLPRFVPNTIRFTLYCLPQDKNFLLEAMPQHRIKSVNAKWHSLAEQYILLSTINEDQLDLMHFTYFGHPILYKGKYISTVHDVTPLLYQTGRASTKNALLYFFKHKVFSFVLKNQVSQSKAIITPTQTVKEQLISIYGETIQDKVFSIYEGVSYRLKSISTGLNLVGQPYLLYVGNYYPHKNILFMIRAFAKSNISHKLVLAGPHDFFLKRILSELTSEEKKNIQIRDKQSLTDLASLYAHADALIHPSISEGFGLPLAEAMYYNLPVITSHIPVFQELLGESYYSFDPYNENSLIEAIHYFVSQKEKKSNVLNKEFSFETMTRKTVDLYLKYA
jgi:glycosyltransferase involved in cell wall biosynthesis